MTAAAEPHLVMIGGPNGSGKSTAAPSLLRDTLAVFDFVNADLIARGLSGFDPAGSAVAAGRVMLERLRTLAARRADLAFETTMASRSFEPWLRSLRESGYRAHLVFLWLPSAEMALERVRRRVRLGGHDVPEAVVRRRYRRGAVNFRKLYRPLASSWRVYDNSLADGPALVARKLAESSEEILDDERWQRIQASWQEAPGH